MIKKLFYGMMAATMLFATSCQQDDVLVQGGDTISFEVSTPQIATRAYSDGTTAEYLHYAVYNDQNTLLYTENGVRDDFKGYTTFDQTTGKATVQLKLATGKAYKVLFWASAEQNVEDNVGPYTINFNTLEMTVNAGACNDEARDAFYKFHPVNGERVQAVTLTRPFAQLNIGTNDLDEALADGIDVAKTQIKVTAYNTLDLAYGTVDNEEEQVFALNARPNRDEENFPVTGYDYLAMSYVLVKDKVIKNVEFTYGETNTQTRTFNNIPLQRNHRTNIYGSLLTNEFEFNVDIEEDFDNNYGIEDEKVSKTVKNIDEFNTAFNDPDIDIIILDRDINLNDIMTRTTAQDPTYTIAAGKTLTIDLNGKKLSATSTQTGANYNMFDVRGTLTMKNGTIEYEHKGENMHWNNFAEIFYVGFNGTLNLDGVTAKNMGGSEMAYVIDMCNATNITVNIKNSVLESTYIPIRVFNNNSTGVNNVTVEKSTLKGKYCFWVQYWLADGRDEATLKNTLNLNIFNSSENENEFIYNNNYNTPILLGYADFIMVDSYGITKSVSEDGTEVILGSLVENGLIRRGVAGDEENTTIKNVVVGEGVTNLYDRTFRRFYALETVELPNTLTIIGQAGSGVFQSCTALKNIVIPESVTTLGKGSFQECSSLESINIPAGVTRIEENCLRATGLVEVEFHANVTYFGAQAFRDCKQLKEVVINAKDFTIEPNAFGVMSGTLPGTIIYVANAEMKAYLESTLAYKNQFTIVAPNVVDNAADMAAAFAEGKNVVMSTDIYTEAATTAPYGNKYGFKMDGGVLDGNNHELDIECYGDDYGIMATGGTIKNIKIDNATRAIMLMYADKDLVLDNVNIGGDGVLYPINTGEAGEPQNVNIIVTNSTLAGWTSFAQVNSASFTNVEFKQGTYYNNIYGRVLKPYVNTTITNCSFVEHMNLDLSGLTVGHKVVIKNSTVNGQKITLDVLTVPSTDDDYDTKLFTVDLPSWATSVADCVVCE